MISNHARIQEFSWGGGGVQVNLTKKALTFFFFFLVLSLFYGSQMVNFKENYHFSRFGRGSNIFQGGGGGPTFSRVGGGSYCLFPIETHITCDFPGGFWTPCPPLWIRTCQQCGILTSVDSDEPVQPPFKLRNSKWCSVSSLTVIEY